MPRLSRTLLALLAVAAATGCGPSATPAATLPIRESFVPPTTSSTALASPATSSSPSPDARTTGWRTDLAGIVPQMAALHPQLDHGVSIDELNAAVTALSEAVSTSTDDELMVGVMKIVAMVSRDGCDGHTGAFVWGTGTYPVDSLPLRLWLFEEGLFVVDALPPYQSLVGSQVETLAGHPIDEVIAALEPLVPRDNAQTLALLLPRFLVMPQVLRGLGLSGKDGPIALTVTSADEGTRDVDVEPISMADYNAWAGPYGLHLPVDPEVPYLARIDDPLWLDGPNADGVLFVQYNRVEFLTLGELARALTDAATKRVILDLRHNYGGEVRALDPFFSAIATYATGHPGTLYVITGRNTFSAGSLLVARLDAHSNAVIVGQPMGGCPTAWGNSRDFDLPFSGITVSVSTFFEVGVDPDDTRSTIEPDLPAPVTAADWKLGIDRALVTIQASAP